MYKFTHRGIQMSVRGACIRVFPADRIYLGPKAEP